MKSPWLTTVVSRQPELTLNRPIDWFGGVTVSPTLWSVERRSAKLWMSTESDRMVGLRYAHPDGTESYCYNTKFADVRWQTGPTVHTSTMGELEILLPAPSSGIPLHPTEDWTQKQGDYFSG